MTGTPITDNGDRSGELEFEDMSDDISDYRSYDTAVLIVFVALILIVGLQFFTRYVLNDSLGWTEEIARYLLILLGFLGSIVCVRKNTHINLEFFYRYVPHGSIKPLVLLVDTLMTAFFAYAGILAIELAQRTSAQMMVSVEIPKAVIYYTVVGACFAMALLGTVRLVRTFRLPRDVVAAEKIEHAE